MFKFSMVVFDYRRCSFRLAVGLIVLPLLSLVTFFGIKESNGITDLQIKQFQFLLLTKISIITTFVEIKTTNVVIR